MSGHREVIERTSWEALSAAVDDAVRRGAVAEAGSSMRTVERDEHVAPWVGRRPSVTYFSRGVLWPQRDPQCECPNCRMAREMGR